MVDLKKLLLEKSSNTYNSYYKGKMSYKLHGKEWSKYVREAFPNIESQITSENIFKDVVDLYKGNVLPTPVELQGMKNVLAAFLSRGEALAVLAPDGSLSWPERYEVISDGNFSIAAVFTRNLAKRTDNVIFIDSDGNTSLSTKPVPDDLSPATRGDYKHVEKLTGFTLYHFRMADDGMGPSLASLQDRVNHSIIDQTVIAEMYARPFWYLLNYQAPPRNPYMDNQPAEKQMQEEPHAGGRLFTTSAEGPFGQLDPPTIGDMISYHDSLISKVSQSTGIPEYYFRPGSGNTPSGVALRVLRDRFNNSIKAIRDAIRPELMRLAEDVGVEGITDDGFDLWSDSDDLLQESLDHHGLALVQMGYPLDYVAEVVTPGVDLDNYLDDSFNEARRDSIVRRVREVSE